MAMTRRSSKHDSIILNTIEDLVPQDHDVRKLDSCIEWDFIYPLVKELYSDFGRPSIDPVVLFKMVFINIIFGVHSMRKTCREIQVNLAYRWFLGISMDEEVPNYSTWSQNYIRRYGDSDVFEQIFDQILKQAMGYGFVDMETVFGDSTHQKANANKNKSIDKEVEIIKKVYEDELLDEINKDREAHGKKPLKANEKEEFNFDEASGKLKRDIETKHIKVSKTDEESGCFHKGEKEKCFAYSHQTFCDKNGFVVLSLCVPGNVHDSVSFFPAYHVLNEKYKDQIKNLCLDAGYITPAICKTILEHQQKMYAPYKRPMTKKGFFKKYEYVYDEVYDCYICPNIKLLEYSITNKLGYKEYKSNPEDCKDCPFLKKCTQSKNHQKVVTRHVWEEYREEVMDEIRHTPEWKKLYPLRKESIERVFGDCKEHHNLRYTRLRGLEKNQHQALMIFACHNLKRMARWSWKTSSDTMHNWLKMMISLYKTKKRKAVLAMGTTLSTI
ncbi:IS1182 family transposase [Amedibacillus sp. YH-ame6]